MILGIKVAVRAYLTFALLVATSFATCSLSSLPTQSIAFAADSKVVTEDSLLADDNNSFVDARSCNCSESFFTEGYIHEEYFTFTNQRSQQIPPAFAISYIYNEVDLSIDIYEQYKNRPPPDAPSFFVQEKISTWQPQLARNFA